MPEMQETCSLPRDNVTIAAVVFADIIIHSFALLLKLRRMRWAGNVARRGANMNSYRILVGKPEGKRQLEDQDVGGLR
jgi:hypothetical protein